MDRLSIRKRPDGAALMHQKWDKLLFLHWPISPREIRPLVPSPLDLDLHGGQAWIGVIPFTIRDIRPLMLPAIPVLSESHEINVRTYVQVNGVPGVWFFSLDASNSLAVLAARLGFHLPYFEADMSLEENAGSVAFTSRRTDRRAPPAQFAAKWEVKDALAEPDPESLDFFLTERYCLYAKNGETLLRARIHHEPWPLANAEVASFTSSMIESHGLATPNLGPRVHALRRELAVDIWAPENAAQGT